MAKQTPGFTFSADASADLSTKQYFCIVINSDAQIAVAGNGVAIDGILQDKPSAQSISGEIMADGISKVSAAGAVTKGDYVACDANGQIETAATGGDYIIGKALETSATAGDLIAVLLNSVGRKA